ncbi:MAG TPA: class I SAM-dependent methyltransferase [Kofleriaceae bacterium]|nr:class I SAM-dependent methyltransferase [Kofleriaceae bacterium]
MGERAMPASELAPRGLWSLARDLRNPEFVAFQDRFPIYGRTFRRVAAHSAALAVSAYSVYLRHRGALGPIAAEVLGPVERHGPADFVERYVARVGHLQRMQRAFEADPCSATLSGDRAPVDRATYDVTLAMSSIFTAHRFEIRKQLCDFVGWLRRPAGRIGSIGMGTGDELRIAARALPGWDIEGYDSDPRTHASVERLLADAGSGGRVRLGSHLPLDRPDASLRGAYDALILCELLEHLEAPLDALRCVRAYLRPGGAAFVTMAVNLAQEDHVYLYRDLAACRDQLRGAGLARLFEWVSPAEVLPADTQPDREREFRSGNYVAVVVRDSAEGIDS